MDRKTFLLSSTRLLILSVITGIIVILFRKGKISSTAGCEVNKFCDGCGSFVKCDKAQALKQKADERK